MPLVLHGASGVSNQDLKISIKYGVNKIKFNTDFQQIFTKKLGKFLQKILKFMISTII
jgi:fructose/tagatose bisphosphate aldolase